MKRVFVLGVVLVLGVPLCGRQDEYPHPIPNWHGSYGQWVPRAIEMPPCVIVRKDGKRYRYVKSNLPGGVQPKKRLTNKDLQKLKDRGAGVQILEPRYTKDDLEKAWQACAQERPSPAH